ncbi:MAG: hypothetical protein IJ179_03045 [Oscillospiraceae bacterium]|nr:hypothetical protein [Oscillospiraceae bacterium]
MACLFALILLPVWSGAASAEDAGLIDTDRLDQWMAGYVEEHGLNANYERFSVGFCYTATGESWYYDADQWMYSASLYKVPVAMLMAEKEAAGELTQETNVLGMPLQYWESTALTYSNNDSGHAMVDYLGGTYLGKCSDMTIRFTDLPEDYFDEDFYINSYYTARYMTQIMRTLCEGGEEQFPHVIEYLLPAQPDNYLNIRLKGRFDVAQKYGSYEEPNGNKNDHIAAIVYTPTPIIVTVMTRNVGDYQARMAEIGEYLADYALELDAKAAELEAEKAVAAQAAEPTPDVEATPEPAVSEGEPAAAETPAPAEQTVSEPAQAMKSGGPRWVLPVLIVLVLALVLVIVLIAVQSRKRKAARRRAAARAAARKAAARETAVRSKDQDYSPRH